MYICACVHVFIYDIYINIHVLKYVHIYESTYRLTVTYVIGIGVVFATTCTQTIMANTHRKQTRIANRHASQRVAATRLVRLTAVRTLSWQTCIQRRVCAEFAQSLRRVCAQFAQSLRTVYLHPRQRLSESNADFVRERRLCLRTQSLSACMYACINICVYLYTDSNIRTRICEDIYTYISVYTCT